MKVLVVDDQVVARDMFMLYINTSERYDLAGSVSSAAKALSFISENHVDIVIMDILMSDGSNGLSAARDIKERYPGVKIVAVTSMVEPSWLKLARRIGIESFWYKEAQRETILDILYRTAAGECVYPDNPPSAALGLAGSESFTDRELEVLRLMTMGLPNSKIAQRLNISEGTVKTYIHNMLVKTGFDNRTELAIEARVKGIAVSLE
ncbi:MAG: LuxR C-terminal-related transcriptional regulator [Oscillospiraceae bacterium]